MSNSNEIVHRPNEWMEEGVVARRRTTFVPPAPKNEITALPAHEITL